MGEHESDPPKFFRHPRLRDLLHIKVALLSGAPKLSLSLSFSPPEAFSDEFFSSDKTLLLPLFLLKRTPPRTSIFAINSTSLGTYCH